MAMLMWILLHEIIDQDTQEDEPQKDECPRRRRPLGRGLEPRPPWCVIDPLHDRNQKTLSEEEIVEKRNAERNAEEQRVRIKRAKRTLTVIAWSALTVTMSYFVYVRPLVFSEAKRVWFGPPRLVEFDPESIRGFASSVLWLTSDMIIFFLPILFMLIWMGSILKGWEEDDRFEK